MADYRISLGVDVNTGDIQSQINGIRVDPIKLTIDVAHASSQIQKIKSQILSLNNIKINLGTGYGRNGSGAAGAVNDMNWAYKQMLDVQKRFNSLSLKMNGLDPMKNANELRELSLQFARLNSDYQTLKTTFGSQLTPVQLGNLQAELDETSAKLAAMDAKFKDTKANFAKNITGNFSTFSKDIARVNSEFSKLSNKPVQLGNDIKQLSLSFKGMQNAAKTGNISKLIGYYEKYQSVLKNVQNQLNINARAEKDAAATAKLLQDRKLFQSGIDEWLTKNSAAAKQFGARLTDLKTRAESCNSVQLDGLRREFALIDKEAGALNLKTKTFGDRIKDQFSKYSQYFSVAYGVMIATRALRDMFNQVVSIDTAMTELRKVTNETDASYDSFLRNASSRAKEIGTTIDGLVNSTADFARLGYSFKESQGLAEVANIYSVVGDEVDGVDGATQSLVSTLAAFKHEMGDMSDSDFAMSIVDKFNEVSNNFAISSGGIGEALQRSASSLATANNTLDESIALITAAM